MLIVCFEIFYEEEIDCIENPVKLNRFQVALWVGGRKLFKVIRFSCCCAFSLYATF
jgi:hypothetical protein